MSKFNQQALQALYIASLQCYFEEDDSALLQLSKRYGRHDVDIIYQLFVALEEEPHTSMMTLIANGLSWQTQKSLFGDFNYLRVLSTPSTKENGKIFSQIQFDDFVVPIWQALTKQGVILISHKNSNQYQFIHSQTGMKINISFKR